MFGDRPPLEEIGKPDARLKELEYRLRRVSPDRAVRLLLPRLVDGYPPIRHRVADELAALISEGLLSAEIEGALIDICRAAIDRAPDSLVEAIRRLGVEAPAEPVPAVRQAACRVLAGAGRDHADMLREALEDEAPDVRYRALVSLHDVDTESMSPDRIAAYLADEDRDVSLVAAQWLAEVGATAQTEAIIEAWREAPSQMRMAYASALGELIGVHGANAEATVKRQLVEELIEALEKTETASAAVDALVQLEARQAVRPLENLMGGWFVHPIVRTQAAAALIQFGESAGREHLQEALEDGRDDVRGSAIRAVGRLKLESFRDHIHEVAHSSDYHADTAVLALAEWGDERERRALETIAQERGEEPAGQLAERALAQLRASGRVDTDRLQFLPV